MTDPLDPGRSVGVYVHWPYCSRICPYCDFNVVRDRGRVEEQARLAEAIDRDWWTAYRNGLEQRFRQDEVLVRATAVERL